MHDALQPVTPQFTTPTGLQRHADLMKVFSLPIPAYCLQVARLHIEAGPQKHQLNQEIQK